MIHRRSFATAGFAFASQFYRTWGLPLLPNSVARCASTIQRQPKQPLFDARSQCDHKYGVAKATCFEKYYCFNRCHYTQRKYRFSRLFGSKSGSGTPGAITIQDDQKVLLNIDLVRLQQTATEIRKHLASTTKGNDYETYDVSIFLVDDEAMQEANNDSRKINKPTDILSYQFHDAIEPGKLEDPLLDVADYYNLGDILIDVPYVIRSCQDDRRDAEGGISAESPAETNDALEEEEDDWVDDDRGVSGAMSKVFDPELRINMLLVHGMLHLVGYDHEEDADYELMVTKEEKILQILQSSGILKLPTTV